MEFECIRTSQKAIDAKQNGLLTYMEYLKYRWDIVLRLWIKAEGKDAIDCMDERRKIRQLSDYTRGEIYKSELMVEVYEDLRLKGKVK